MIITKPCFVQFHHTFLYLILIRRGLHIKNAYAFYDYHEAVLRAIPPYPHIKTTLNKIQRRLAEREGFEPSNGY